MYKFYATYTYYENAATYTYATYTFNATYTYYTSAFNAAKAPSVA